MLLLFVIVGFLLPAQFRVERSITINAPIEKVFTLVDNLEMNEQWSPWKRSDPSITFRYGEIKSGEGASYEWASRHSGAGSLIIVESKPYSLVRTELDFRGKGKAEYSWTFEKGDQGVAVIHSFSSDSGYNRIARYFGLLMDTFMGQNLERALANLRDTAEVSDVSTEDQENDTQ